MPAVNGGSSAAGSDAAHAAAPDASSSTPVPAYRQLQFYEPARIRDAADLARPPAALRQPNLIAALCRAPVCPPLPPVPLPADEASGSAAADAPPAAAPASAVLLADISGDVHVLHPASYAPLARWNAYAAGRVTHLSADARGRVVTLGEEDGIRFPVLRIWDLRVLQSGTAWSPRLMCEGKVQHGSRPHPVAALAHTSSLSYLSLALADGSVLLLRSLDAVLQSAAPAAAGAAQPVAPLPKFKVVYQPSSGSSAGGTEPVTALGFSETLPAAPPTEAPRRHREASSRRRPARAAPPSAPAAPPAAAIAVQLFIVTLTRTLRYNVLGTGAGSPAAVVDDVGCALGCGAVVPGASRAGDGAASELAGKMVVAREEAIYVVGPDGREVCLAYEGPKSSIHLSDTQLVIVSPPMAASAASASATVRNHVNARDRQGHMSPLGASPAGRAPPLNGASGRRGSAAPSEVAKVTVFDLENKLVAYSGTFEGGVRLAWTGENGEVLVLGDDGTLTRLEEKALRAKLDLLFRKSLFLVAVSVARSHAARSAASAPNGEAPPIDALLGEIFRRYGDHLYTKGDFDGAMAQFVKTIGVTQPSYVIRKFLDAQRINNLTTYLQELHARGLANSDHTTLLLNCFTKLKDVASLDRFIKRPMPAGADSHGPQQLDADGETPREELPFDLSTAIRVCRQAGYHGHAAYLAKRYHEHDEYMRIQLEDAHDFEDALGYVRSLRAADAELYLQRYGKLLLAELPDATTDLLIELCSGAFSPKPIAVGAGIAAAQERSVAAAYLSYLQVGHYGKPANASAQQKAAGGADTSASTPSMPPHTSERASLAIEPYHLDGVPESNGAQAPADAYHTPSPRTFFAHFIRHPAHFVRFLETVALARWGQSVDMDTHAASHEPLAAGALAPLAATVGSDDDVERALRELGMEPSDDVFVDEDHKDQCAIWNTLLELYLASARDSNADPDAPAALLLHVEHGLDGTQRRERRERALHLLEQHEQLPYDITQALVLCSMESFTEGLVLLYERMGMYEDVLRFWMDASTAAGARDEASAKVMAALWRYGPSSPQLYPMVLRYLVSSEAILERHHADVAKVLKHIEDEGLMGPLEVVQALGRTGVASVGIVREHLTRAVLQEREEIEADRRLIDSYRGETAKKLAEVAELTDADAPRVFQLTRCSACGGQLDLPSVHFMCKHSYHQRCLGDNEAECPSCARSHGVVREIRRNNEALADRHELFMQEVEEAEDGFDAVARMFSKGMFQAALGQ